MAQCEVCGNNYDKAFEVIQQGTRHTFDSFECAISALAPKCDHCGCRVIGHGVEADGRYYCCAHCAREQGQGALRDRADQSSSRKGSAPASN
jgi:hypothetical protein